jgi:hypothetical protein
MYSLDILMITQNCCMKKMLRLVLGNVPKLALLFALFIGIGTAHKANAQVINEGFEESFWQNMPNSSGGVISVTSSTTSMMTYYLNGNASSSSFTTNGAYTLTVPFINSSTTTGGNSTRTSYTVHYTTTAPNTSPNTGNWWYSRATTNSDTRLNKVRSVATSIQLSTSGYLITPVINGGVASLTLWMAPSNTFIVGINTNTAAAQPTYTSNGTNTLGGFTYFTQSFPASGTTNYSSMQSFTFPFTYSGACQVGVFNGSSSSMYLDDIVISGFPVGTLPTLTLNTAVKNGQFGGNATATITANNPAPNSTIFQSGIIWSTSNTHCPILPFPPKQPMAQGEQVCFLDLCQLQ